jgi:hypothetical protein
VDCRSASLALAVKANRRPAAFWLNGGVVAGAVGMVLTGIAPSAAVACAGQGRHDPDLGRPS